MKCALISLLILACAGCQIKPFTYSSHGQRQVSLGATFLKKSRLDYARATLPGGGTIESVVRDGDETIVPVKAAEVYQVTKLADLALEGVKQTVLNPNKIPKDPNLIPKDPNVIPADPNVIPLDPNQP